MAEKARFSSVEDMYFRLQRWGLSGLLPPPAEPGGAAPEKIPKKRDQHQGAGDAEKLPSAADAIPLFEVALADFRGDLYHTKHLAEFYGEDGRFYGYSVYPPQTTTYTREDFSPEGWEEWCAEQDKDPATTEEITVTWDKSGARGAWRYPDRWLTGLIAMYLLRATSWREVELLVEKLHPRPATLDRETMRRLINGVDGHNKRNDGLFGRARLLAELVRGGEGRRGRKDPISMREHGAALDARSAEAQDTPEDDINRTVGAFHGMGEEEIRDLRKMFPPMP